MPYLGIKCHSVCEHSSYFCYLIYRYAESVGAKHYHTSAKQNKGIEELFLDLCKSKFVLCLLTAIHIKCSHTKLLGDLLQSHGIL